MIDFGLQTLFGLIKMLLLIFSIVMPLIVILEVFREYGLLARAAKALEPFTGRIGIKRDAVFPFLAGLIFGISYGAGVLISESKSGRITAQQAFIIAVFLAVCHAIVEDTLLFVAYGAVWWIAVSTRLAIAITVTFIAALILRRSGFE